MSEQSESMQFGVGDGVTVMRGLDRGKVGTVLNVDKVREQYAIKFADGGVAVINAVNVRVPDEPSITAGQLSQAFGDWGKEIPDPVMENLESLVPGITDRIVAG